MEVLKARAAFLSNYEVYSLLKEMETKQIDQTRAFMAIKKEENLEDQYKGPNFVVPEEVAENVRTIQVELLQYLNGESLPTSKQSAESVAKLTRGLRDYGLTKAEKLQIINLYPQSVLDLYVIVEEVQDRLGDRISDVLSLVQERQNEDQVNIRDSSTANVALLQTSEANRPNEVGELVTEQEEEDIWGGEEPAQYIEEEFADVDDFEPMLELDEMDDQRD